MGWIDIIERLKNAVGLTDNQIASLERRGRLRVQKRVPLVGIRPNSEQVHMVALDFAQRGIRVETGRAVQKDELFTVYVTRKASQVFRDVEFSTDVTAPRASVVWVKYLKDKMSWEAGLSFHMETDTEVANVALFLLEDCGISIGEGREHRTSPRLSTELDASMKIVSTHETIAGKVRDIAVGGLLLMVPVAVPRHTIVELTLQFPGDPAPLTCRGVVVRSLPKGTDSCELGIALTVVADDHKQRLIKMLSKRLTEQTRP